MFLRKKQVKSRNMLISIIYYQDHGQTPQKSGEVFYNYLSKKTEELYCLATIIAAAEFSPLTNTIAVKANAAANVIIAAVTAAVQGLKDLRDRREFRDLPVLRVLPVKPQLLRWALPQQALPELRLPLQIQARRKMLF